MNIVLIGRTGQVAGELQHCLSQIGRLTVVGRPELDLTNLETARQAIRQLRPDILVNAAAYTAVDQAESEPQVAMAVNANAPKAMAEEAQRINALFINYSTDYVFDGTQNRPYGESDTTNPLNAYGRSKLAGDCAVQEVGGQYLIFRTSWVYGPRGKNFLRTIMRLAVERDELRIVDDQVGAPTSSCDIAEKTGQIIKQLVQESGGAQRLGKPWGIYNLTSGGEVSWFGFAVAIIEEMRARRVNQALARVVPISSKEYPAAALRPRNSRLSNEKLRATFGLSMPDWRKSLSATMDKLAVDDVVCPSR